MQRQVRAVAVPLTVVASKTLCDLGHSLLFQTPFVLSGSADALSSRPFCACLILGPFCLWGRCSPLPHEWNFHCPSKPCSNKYCFLINIFLWFPPCAFKRFLLFKSPRTLLVHSLWYFPVLPFIIKLFPCLLCLWVVGFLMVGACLAWVVFF